MSESIAESQREKPSQQVSIHYPSGQHDAYDIRSLFLDARGMLESQQKSKRDERPWYKNLMRPHNRTRPIPNAVDTQRLLQKFESEEGRKDNEPRSIIAKIPNPVGSTKLGTHESVGYVLLGEPRKKDDGTHVEIEDVAVKRAHRGNPVMIKTLMDSILKFRVDGKPIIFDTGAVDRTYQMLTHPRIGELLEKQGYKVVDHHTMQEAAGENFHDISLVPITHDEQSVDLNPIQ